MNEFLGSGVLRDRLFTCLNSQVWTVGVRAQQGIRHAQKPRRARAFSLRWGKTRGGYRGTRGERSLLPHSGRHWSPRWLICHLVPRGTCCLLPDVGKGSTLRSLGQWRVTERGEGVSGTAHSGGSISIHRGSVWRGKAWGMWDP